MKDYKFSKCVDQAIQEQFMLKVNCVLPLLTNENHCKKMSRAEYLEKMDALAVEFMTPYFMSLENPAEQKCQDPCLKQIITVNKRSEMQLTSGSL